MDTNNRKVLPFYTLRLSKPEVEQRWGQLKNTIRADV